MFLRPVPFTKDLGSFCLQSTSRSVQVVCTHLMIPTYRNRRMNFNCVYFGQQQLTGAKLGGANLLGAIRWSTVCPCSFILCILYCTIPLEVMPEAWSSVQYWSRSWLRTQIFPPFQNKSIHRIILSQTILSLTNFVGKGNSICDTE